MLSDNASRKFQKELNAGAISLVLMSVLQRHGEPMYGYEIAHFLEALTPEPLPMNQAAIYPVLRSLEKQRLLCSRMVPSESGPPRKYYQLTASGVRAAAEWKSIWTKTTAFVDSLLETRNVTGIADARCEIPRAVGGEAKAQGRRRS